jgi:iron complex outermembrane receptor protein
MHRLLAILVPAMLFVFDVFGQNPTCNLSISGFVKEAEDQKVVPFATIYIKELGTGTATDESGYFRLDGLCEGNYTLVCSHVGCDHAVEKVELKDSTQLNFALSHSAANLTSIEVIAKPVEQQSIGSLQKLDGLKLQESLQGTLAGTIGNLPGVSILSTGATIAKPVINGLHSDRVLVLQNGIKIEGNQWGTEHAPEIDPFSAGNIEVEKGAGALVYGPEAIGGVVSVKSPRLPSEPGLEGSAFLMGESNGQVLTSALRLSGKWSEKFPLSGSIQGTYKKGGTLRTADYFLANTANENLNFQWQLAYAGKNWDVQSFYSQYNATLGIFSGSHIGNLTDLQRAINAETPLVSGGFTYDINRPYQEIEHEITKISGNYLLGHHEKIHLTVARQFNRRQEFDAHKPGGSADAGTTPETQFELTTWNLHSYYEHKVFNHISGKLGIQASHQVNTTDRGGLIPDYQAQTIGLYLTERWKNYPFPWEFEFALRSDWKKLEAQFRNEDDFSRTFSNFSGSIGALYKPKTNWNVSANFASTWRQPNVSELFSNGVHHGVAAFETGDRNLQPEVAYRLGIDFQAGETGKAKLDISLYNQFIQDFIYLNPQQEFELTIRGAFPVFAYEHANAHLYGLDAQGSLPIYGGLGAEGKVSILRARNLELNDWLPLMPADRFSVAATFNGMDLKNVFPLNLKFGFQHVFRQTRVADNSDFAPAPNAFTLLFAQASYEREWANQTLRLTLKGENLANQSYRSYLNRFRYFADDMGRNISLSAQLIF